MLLRQIGIVAFVASCVWASSQVGHAATDLRNPGVIRVTSREVTSVSHGGTDITRLKLYNRRITRKAIGRGVLVCVSVGGAERSCTGTFALPRGKIIVGGTVFGISKISNLAVLGGTGLYDNVRGQLTVTALGGRPPSHLLLFRLEV